MELDQQAAANAAIRVIAKNFYIYCERNLMIKDKATYQIVPFVPNWAQKLLVDQVLADLINGVPIRYIILKARQMGLSTIIEALCYWWTTTHRYINSVIIAHETEASANLYKMFRRYYDYSHPHFQPDRKYNTKKDLTFDVEDEVKKAHQERGENSPGLASEIKTLVAREGKGRSDTINFFHGSEVAFWEESSDVVSGVLQAIPMAKNTFAFLESTANGVGGYFYDEWQHAKKGESAFRPLFFAWHEHSEYELEGAVSEHETYDDEENDLIKIFEEKGYPEESWHRKILWRREKKKEFRSEPDKFYQEYPKDDMEAFLASGRPVFDIRALVDLENRANKTESPMFGEVKPNPNSKSENKYMFEEIPVTFEGHDPAPLKVWELPEKNRRYTIGVDVSEGKLVQEGAKSNDFSVVDVMDIHSLKTVARWRGHIDPDLLGEVVFNLGMFYNDNGAPALVGVEVNNHGLTTVQSLRNKFYRNLYMRETSEEDAFQERTARMGWRTDRKTKPLIIQELVKAIRDNDIVDSDIIFIRECMTYVRDDQGYTAAQKNMFDDTVMAKAINLQMAQYSSLDAGRAKESIQKPIKRSTHGSSESIEEISAGARRPRTNTDAVQRRRSARQRHRRTGRRD